MTSLKTKLIAFTMALIALFGSTVITQALFQVRANLLEQINLEFNALLGAQEETIRLWLAEKTRQITTQADSALHANALTFLKQGAKAGNFNATYIGFADGTSIFSDDWVPPKDYEILTRDWYTLAAATKKPVLTPPYIDEGTHQLTITISAPIIDKEQVRAVVAGDILLTDLAKIILSQTVRGNGYFFLLNAEGTLIAHPQDDLSLKPLSALTPDLKPENIAELASKHHILDVTIAGKNMLLSLQPIKNTSWLVGVVTEKDSILQPLRALIYNILGSALLLFVLAIPFSGVIVGGMLRGLYFLKNAMSDISEGDGDLTVRLSNQGRDEIAFTARAFNAFIDKLNGLFRTLHKDAGEVITGVEKTNQLVLTVADNSHKLSEVVASNTSAVQRMTTSIEQIADNARGVNSLAGSASEELASSSSQMQRFSQDMEHTAQSVRGLETMLSALEKRSEEIRGFTTVIRGIADQTNLLALNAAIEAARAGESGRGFAVVADEVRKLAERTTQATTSIAEMVESIHSEAGHAATDVNHTVTAVNEGVQQTREASQNIETIRKTMSQVVSKMQEIVEATTEQSHATTRIVNNASQFDEVQEMLKETRTSLEELSVSANKMEGEFARFKL